MMIECENHECKRIRQVYDEYYKYFKGNKNIRSIMKACFSRVNDRNRKILKMLYIDNMKYREIADDFGLSDITIRQVEEKFFRMIRGVLTRHCIDSSYKNRKILKC